MVSFTDLTLNEYEKDTEADAVVIYDKGKSVFYRNGNGFDISFVRSTRIKVLKESGIKYGEIQIPFYRSDNIFEKIVNIEAYTYNYENGQIQKTALNPEQIFEEKISEFVLIKKFAFPNVKEGSVIEYRYELLTPYLFHLPDWEFQREIPTIHSEYIVHTIPFYEYQWILQGANKFHRQESYKDLGLTTQFGSVDFNEIINIFEMKDIPAFKDESFITSKDDYIIKLDFQLAKLHLLNGGEQEILTSWERLSKELIKNEHYGKYINSAKKKYSSTVGDENLNALSEKERLEFIINDIKRKYNWNGYNRYSADKSVKEFLSEKKGTSGEINLFFTGALNAAEIEAYPVIISTRDHGRIIKDYPFENAFNYTIVYAKIDDKWGLYDATDIFCPNNRLPVKCINDLGLLIKKGDTKWIKLIPNQMSVTDAKFKISFPDNADELNCLMTINLKGYDALEFRKEYKNDKEELESILEYEDYELVEEISTQNYEDVNKPYIIEFNYKTHTERIKDKLIIDPFQNMTLKDNPLKQKERQYPVDLIYLKSRFFTTEISIPEAYKVEILPEEKSFINKNFSLQYKISSQDDKITIQAMYQFNKTIFQADDYLKIKTYFDLIIKYLNQEIVLVKKD